MTRRLLIPATALLTATASLLVLLTVATAIGSEPAAKDATSGKLRHIVVFKFKEGTSAEKVQEIVDAFAALPKQIDSIVDFECGVNNSPEGHDQGFTHVFQVTFADEAGREKYLPHPAHKAFVKLLMPHLEKVFVVDYFAQ